MFVSGKGPAVIVMAEMPGIYPHVARFARWCARRRLHRLDAEPVGVPGRAVTAERGSILRGAAVIARACISREFRAFAANASSPVIDWLRQLAAHAHPLCGGRGVGAIGMCFTGNFALSLMLEPAVRAPVLSQPSLPLLKRDGLHIAPHELSQVRARMQREDLTVLAYASKATPSAAPSASRPQAALGDRFVPRVLPTPPPTRGGDEEPAQRGDVAPDRLRRRADDPGRATRSWSSSACASPEPRQVRGFSPGTPAIRSVSRLGSKPTAKANAVIVVAKRTYCPARSAWRRRPRRRDPPRS